jgi:myo-inositol-1(or 4)-monophosphatase
VVVDPIDGSLNAKRGLPHHCVSIAVAEGPTMADVSFGFVQDFGPEEEWVAWRGRGATLNGRPLDPSVGERRWAHDGLLEVVGFESADPRWVLQSAEALVGVAHRLRAIGTIAAALCQVAAGRFDGMLTLKGCRAVDAAAAQLIVREAGGLVAFTAFPEPLAAPLDLLPHSPVVAARTEAALQELAAVPSI